MHGTIRYVNTFLIDCCCWCCCCWRQKHVNGGCGCCFVATGWCNRNENLACRFRSWSGRRFGRTIRKWSGTSETPPWRSKKARNASTRVTTGPLTTDVPGRETRNRRGRAEQPPRRHREPTTHQSNYGPEASATFGIFLHRHLGSWRDIDQLPCPFLVGGCTYPINRLRCRPSYFIPYHISYLISSTLS